MAEFKYWFSASYQRTLQQSGYTEFSDGWTKYPWLRYIDCIGAEFQVADFKDGELFVAARFGSVEAAIVYVELEIANGH